MDEIAKIKYVQVSSEGELQQILNLQQENLPKNLSVEEIKIQGFLTVEHDFELLKAMNDAFPHTLAVENEKVVGYALSMHPKFRGQIEVLTSMFVELEKVYHAQDYIIMGQVCVAKTHRGQGVFRGLYQNMKRFIQPRFKAIITEVDAKNARSMRAHKTIGFRELSRHFSDGKEWSLIVLK